MSVYRLFSNRLWAEKFRQNSRKSIENQSKGSALVIYGQKKIKIAVKISVQVVIFTCHRQRNYKKIRTISRNISPTAGN